MQNHLSLLLNRENLGPSNRHYSPVMTLIPMKPVTAIILALLAATSTPVLAYEQDKDAIRITHSKRTEAYSPQKELASFSLPEGFIIELVASEENGIINPIDLTFDDAGRLWTQTAEMYPLDPFGNKANRFIRAELRKPKSKLLNSPEYKRLSALYKREQKGTDRVLLIDDPTKPVTGQVPTVVQGLTMPQSILPYKNGVYIAHGSEMLYMEDTDGDGQYEKQNTVLTGFSFIDSHTMSHTLVRGPGGWVHFSHGAMNLGTVKAVASGAEQDIDYSKIARFSLDGKKIELVSSGLNNVWGFQLRGDGQWYGSEANDKSHSVVPMEPGTGFLGIGNDKLRSYQPMVPVVHPFRVGGTGISGLAFSDDNHALPEEWRDVAFLANPITNTINTVKVDRDASGNITGTLMKDLLKSDDDWFRPVNIEFGPDGCLYIADWYNKVVSHNEIARTDPSRDKSHGRIWRIRHKNQKPAPIPNLITAQEADLVQHLKGSSRWEKRAAWHQIADRQAKSLLPDIQKIALDPNNTIATRVHAIWSLESLNQFNEPVLRQLLQDSDHNIRREAIRSLASYKLSASQIAKLLEPLLNDPHCLVRSQTLRTLEEVQIEDLALVKLLVSACKTAASSDELGGPYEQNFERYLARKALESYPTTLKKFLQTKEALLFPLSNLMWASQALNSADSSEIFVNLWELRGNQPLDTETFISLTHLLQDKNLAKTVAPNFQNPTQFESILKMVIANEDQINLKNLQQILTPALQKFITSSSLTDQQLAINVAAKIKSTAITKQVKKILANRSDPSLLHQILPIFLNHPKAHIQTLTKLATDENSSFGTRLKLITILAEITPKNGNKLLDAFIEGKSDSQRSAIASRLSQTPKGSKKLLQYYTDQKIHLRDFDSITAQQLLSKQKKNKQAKAILAATRKNDQKHLASLEQKIATYLKACETLEGNSENGKLLFQGSCLACHQVGNQGHDIAPALDGSASRELHALLTAIVNPDAAVEGGYNQHRVVKKDGDVIAGYLYASTPLGTTIASMGNIKTFIPQADIQSQNSVNGKSFMIDAFGSLPEQSMVDLVTYIKTLK